MLYRMKNMAEATNNGARLGRRIRGRAKAAIALSVAVAGLSLLGSPATQSAYGQWVGDVNSDWNNAANWNGDAFPTGNATINNTAGPGVFPVISANSAFTPVDIFVGTGGNTARVDHTAGTAGTGSGNWFFLGITGANATYNLADTSGTGGTYTGFA